ncbi:MAG: CAP domain-containing protein [Geobacter sp.]|nr:CAP domain-containing protein [Geobacter sp.]
MNITGYSAPYAKVLVVGGGTINQAIERLQQRHCEDIANPEFTEIGAVWAKNRWWIVLAFGQEQAAPANAVQRIASQPDTTPVNPSAFLALVNKARAEARRCGSRAFKAVHPLQWQSKLAAAAAVHARDISSKGEFSHTGSDGSQVSDRARREGYDYRAVGENIAMNPMGIAATVESWLDSPGHCANIMNPDFTELGAAIEGSYSVMVFGKR